MLVDHKTVLGLFVVFMPALVWTVALPLGGVVLIDIGRSSIQRTAQSAHYDPLTGLRNRRGMHAAVAAAIRRTSPTSVVIAVSATLTDSNPSTTGMVMPPVTPPYSSLARTLQALAGEDEITARIGGDEFVLVGFVNVDDDTSVLLSRLEPLTHGEVDGVALTASVGVALHPADDPHFSIDDAIRHADDAMYQAKRAGGARCAIYGRVVGQAP